MPLEDLADRLLRSGVKKLETGLRAATGLMGVVRGSGVLRTVTLEGIATAAAAAAAGDHPYGVMLSFHAASTPHRAALVSGDRAITYLELLGLLHRASHCLADLGVAPGDRVLLMMGNCAQWVVSAAAIGSAGATLVPVAVGMRSSSLGHLIENARPRAVICDAERWPVVREALAERQETLARTLVLGAAAMDDDEPTDLEEAWQRCPASPLPPPEGRSLFPGVTMYTSGTTGKPKGVERDDLGLGLEALVSTNGLLAAMAFASDDVTYVPGPLYHAAPLLFLAAHLALGATVVLGGETDAQGMLNAFARWKVTNALLVPTLLGRLVQHIPAPTPGQFPHLRALFTTADKLPIPTAEGIRERFGEVLHDLYGSTETGLVTMATPRDLREHPGTVGRLLPGAQVKLFTERGDEAAANEPGELFARTGLTMAGYRDDPDATRGASRGGLFSVGDVARRDAAGLYYIVGRSAHLLISGGVNVYPAEIEAALHTHPAVAEVAVVGLPDPEWGDRVLAVVVASGEVTVGDLKDWAAARLPKPAQPREYRFWQALPVSPQGKIDKRLIRERLGGQHP